MARYLQRIALLGKERWIGWEIDGVGTELPGLTLADRVSEEELRARGVKEFTPLSFEMFLGMNADAGPAKQLLDQDIDFRLDALQVGIERIRGGARREVPRALLTYFIGGDGQLNGSDIHPRGPSLDVSELTHAIAKHEAARPPSHEAGRVGCYVELGRRRFDAYQLE